MNSQRGITLIEIIIVVALIAILASVVIVAVNPKRNFDAALNIQRHSDLEKILGGLNQYAIEHNGAFPPGVTTTLRMAGTAASGCNVTCGSSTTASACNDFSLVPTYLEKLPSDPRTGTSTKTYYAVQSVNNGNSGIGLILRACSADAGKIIEIRQ